MRYLKLVIEFCRLIGYTKSTVDQATKVYRILTIVYQSFNETDVGPEL